MRLTAILDSINSIDATWAAIGIFDGEPVPERLACSALISSLIESKDVTCSIGDTTALFGSGPNGSSILVYGLGKKATFTAGSSYLAGVAVAKQISSRPRSSVAVALPPGGGDVISAFVEGIVVGTVGPGIRKVEPTRHAFENLILVGTTEEGHDVATIERAGARGFIVGEAVNLARELVNLPPSDKPPVVLAQRAVDVAEATGIGVEVWDLARLKAERFHGLVAVASGSAQEPRFVRLEYRNGGDRPSIALVGKGVTFDSGGLSLKPSASMEDMKCDMTGAAVVLATMQAVAKLGIRANLDGYLPLTENMTGGAAMKLGDVLTMRNGLTVEVLNTDAEGRLILADVLSYATERKPAKILDLATLTGACLVALGSKIAGLFSNHDDFADEVLTATRLTGERAWRLPLDDDFGDLIKSKVAEIKNVGGKWGGAITAAKFLQRFLGETPWVHLDIAGPSWADDESSTRHAGGTGCFVRTLITLIDRQVASDHKSVESKKGEG